MTNDPARRLERAVVALATQVGRLADAMPTPTDDAPTTGSDAPCADAPTAEAQPGPDYEFRDAIGVLVSRAARGVLTADEGPLLRQHVEHLLSDRDRLAAMVEALR
ncbi:hypothetical protein QOM21_23980 [Streptomyces sp. Pv4-95]|uniref:hypothetical protein n=1 Tax=Streptomyces sp. Pv4-95 TaxID=3049543 RepID=UPI0038926FDD